MKQILILEPNKDARDGIRQMMEAGGTGWEVSYVAGGHEVLALLDAGKTFDVLVSELTLLDMDGVEFLTQVKESAPEMVRITLTATQDSDALLKASTLTHQFLSKPCQPHDLRVLILRCFGLREHLKASKLRQRLHDIGGLPSLPILYQEIVKEMHSPDPSVRRVAEIIEKDVGMSAKVLQVVNSAGVGLTNPVSNIAYAASLLGLDKLRTMVLVAEMYSMIENKAMPKGFSAEALWEHSLMVGEFAKKIAKEEIDDASIVDDSFMAGLLHDIGLVILAANLPVELGEAVALARKEKISLFKAEKEVLEATHAEVGGYLVELWGLPDPIAIAITFHNLPIAVPEDNYPSGLPEHGFTPLTAVHVANYFCEDEEKVQYGFSKVEVDTAHLEMLGFTEKLSAWWDACHSDF